MSLEISVIIPTFNREKYIGRCIRSLLTQSIGLTNFEMIVIDDGSTDDSIKVLSAFKNDIKIIQNKKNLGLPTSLNTGIKASRGKYIVRVDSDDYVNKDFLKILHLFVSSNNDYSAAACDYFLVDDDENVIERINCDKNSFGEDVIVVQIAGLIARRIVTECFKDDVIQQGSRIGMIRFGSRADIYFENYKPLVKLEQRSLAGETLLAKR